MSVVKNSEIEKFALPGLVHQTLASRKQGAAEFEVWMQTVEPGAATPIHRHDAEEVILVLRGRGELTIEGETVKFNPDTTLIIPRNAVHQLVNTGHEELFLVAALNMNPVKVCTPDGEPIPLPWS